MAKNVLPVDFQDDILAESMNGRRKYQMITNSDGTVSFVDVTEYTQVGSNFGQAQVNATNEAVNESADKNKIIDDKDDLVANSQAGMIAGALAVKAIREELNQNMTRTSNAVTSGYPVTNYDTYKENGIQHIKAVISATVSPSAAEDSYFTIGFVPEIPLQTEMFAGIYLHNSHIYPVILRISANKNIGIYTSDEITALGNSSGSVFIETSYSI